MSDASTASKVVWFEVPAQDTARAKSFYGELLGWSFQPYDGQDYHTTFGNPQDEGSMAVFKTREAAEEFVAGDPFVLNGVVRGWQIREWNEALT
jgi:predicted enzyme related to lactoylglutathione lyase